MVRSPICKTCKSVAWVASSTATAALQERYVQLAQPNAF